MRKWALLEQALLSLVNFGLALLLARTFEKANWGTYSLGLVLMLFAQGFQRAMVCIPIATMTHDDPTLSRTILFWKRLNLKVTVIAVVCLCLISAVWQLFFPQKWIALSLLIAALLVPGFFMQEFWRRVLIQTGRIKLCALSATLYVAAVGLLAALLHMQQASPQLWALAVTASALAAALFLRKQFKTEPSPVHDRIDLTIKIGRFGKWAVLSHIAYSAYNTGIQLVLSVIAGASAMGSFSAIRTLIQPVNTLIGAIDSIDKPRASRAFASGGFAAMFTSLRKTLTVLLLLGGVYLLISAVFGGYAIDWIYNSRYGTPWQEVWLWCGVAALMLLAQPTESGLYVTNHPEALFRNRVVSAVTGLITALVLVPSMGVSGAVIALASGWLCSALFATWQLYLYARQAGDSKGV